MDQDRFECLTRHVASAPSRRSLLRALVSGAVVGLAPALANRVASADVTPDGSIIKGCRIPGQRCSSDKNCCTGRCTNKRCRCLNKGASCLVDLGGGLPPIPVHANCCTNKCSKHDYKCK